MNYRNPERSKCLPLSIATMQGRLLMLSAEIDIRGADRLGMPEPFRIAVAVLAHDHARRVEVRNAKYWQPGNYDHRHH
jgi:hypothetical protein